MVVLQQGPRSTPFTFGSTELSSGLTVSRSSLCNHLAEPQHKAIDSLVRRGTTLNIFCFTYGLQLTGVPDGFNQYKTYHCMCNGVFLSGYYSDLVKVSVA